MRTAVYLALVGAASAGTNPDIAICATAANKKCTFEMCYTTAGVKTAANVATAKGCT